MCQPLPPCAHSDAIASIIANVSTIVTSRSQKREAKNHIVALFLVLVPQSLLPSPSDVAPIIIITIPSHHAAEPGEN
jgi:hypothetical protein